MKNTFLLSFLMLGFVMLVSGQNQTSPQRTDTLEKAHIEFVELIHDFGQIPLRADASCEFEFTNTGSVPLILSNVRASCGCTVPQWPREPILPGEKGVIKVKYTTVTRPNVINKAVIVHSNADNAQIVLRIKGEVINEG